MFRIQKCTGALPKDRIHRGAGGEREEWKRRETVEEPFSSPALLSGQYEKGALAKKGPFRKKKRGPTAKQIMQIVVPSAPTHRQRYSRDMIHAGYHKKPPPEGDNIRAVIPCLGLLAHFRCRGARMGGGGGVRIRGGDSTASV